MSTSKSGWQTTEFKMAVGLLVAVAGGVVTKTVPVTEAMDFAKWIFGMYGGTRAASKFNADELAGLAVGAVKAVRGATAKPAKLADAAKAGSRL